MVEPQPAGPDRSAPSLAAGPGYRRNAARLLVGLLGFGLSYTSLVVGCIAAPVWAVSLALDMPMLWPLALVAIAVFVPLLALLLLALLHRPRPSGPTQTIDAEAHPRLLAAIEQLAREAGIAVPARVSLGAGVNAAMVAGVGGRELVVGLGLVNVLDVRELEAVLGHEFGHFVQSRVRLGQWTHHATVLLRHVVLGRTPIDARIARGRVSRAWVLRGLAGLTAIGVRGVRRLLAVLLARLTRVGQAFARELELNADLHAVALRGSDPLVAALWRAQRGALAMQAASAQLRALAKHGIRSDDVYVHQTARLGELDERLAAAGDPMSLALRTPYQYGRALHFPAGETPAEIMWYAHPTYREREANAKHHYVAVDEVPRASAWSLFEQPERLRRDMSANLYVELAGASDIDALPAAEVEQRIADELAEREQGAVHHGFYDNRMVDPGPLDELLAWLEAGEHELEQLRADADPWRGPELAAFMARWRELEASVGRLRGIVAGRIEVAPQQVEASKQALAQVQAELERMIADAHRGDRAVFCHAWASATPEQRSELVERYRFLVLVQRAIATLNEHHGRIGSLAAIIDAREYELAQHAPVELVSALDSLWRDLEQLRTLAASVPVPSLRNIEPGRSLAEVLGLSAIEALEPDAKLGPWLGRVIGAAQDVHGRLRSLHYKNLGQLLRMLGR